MSETLDDPCATDHRLYRRHTMNRLGMPTTLVIALLAAACGGGGSGDEEPAVEPPPGLAAAITTYSALRADVLDALSTSVPLVRWEDKPETQMMGQPDGSCVLFLPDALSHDDLFAASSELTDLADALGPVLESHGFGELSAVTYPEHGGDVYVEAADPTGWDVRVSAYPALVEMSGPVDSPGCDDADLTGLTG